MSKGRVETLSDGVFAIAITLLALTITEPSDYQHLARQLGERWPSLAAYAVSFLVIGIMWLNHHSIFSRLARVDRVFVYMNLVLLMTIAFLPYPTGVFGEALRLGDGARTAAVLYSATMAINAYVWSVLWLYAAHERRLLHPSFPEEQRRTTTMLFIAGGAPYTIAVGVALVSPMACLIFHAALALYYALDPISRRAGKAAADTAA